MLTFSRITERQFRMILRQNALKYEHIEIITRGTYNTDYVCVEMNSVCCCFCWQALCFIKKKKVVIIVLWSLIKRPPHFLIFIFTFDMINCDRFSHYFFFSLNEFEMLLFIMIVCFEFICYALSVFGTDV